MKPLRKYSPRPLTQPAQQHPFAALSPRQWKKAQKAQKRLRALRALRARKCMNCGKPVGHALPDGKCNACFYD